MKKIVQFLVFLTYVYHEAWFRECNGVFNYVVCLMAMCVVKQVV